MTRYTRVWTPTPIAPRSSRIWPRRRKRQITQTPTFVINGLVLPGALPYDKIKQYVDDAMKSAPARADTATGTKK